MKIIDLLVKIANEQEVPKKIKFNDYEYLYHDKEHGYCRNGYDCTYICLDSEYYLFDILNDKVEIIEDTPKEDKNIEKLDLQYKDISKGIKFNEQILMYCDNLQYKINEIIDKVNKL